MDVGSYDFLRQERVIFGKPAAQAVAEEAHRLAVGRLFVVCANSLSRKTDAIEAIGEALGHHYVGRFDKCVEHTPRESVIAAADAARHADPDLIVTIGGGTAIDTAKVMLICLAQGVRTPEEMDDLHVSIDADGAPHIPVIAPSPIRQIIVPTTLSGAEFSNLGGCTDSRRKVKDAYTAPDICGQSVILDPEITRHTPEWLWLSTGIRAIDHAVEAVCSSAAQPFTDALALHALRLFATALRRNHHSPDDLAARLDSQQAVWMAASSINRVPYGASHGIGHALGAMAGVSHGHT
ncbi:MAG: iron-containing alcohol dehydrogenase, partial [Alphaproteobacteria bacterium]|nr:iron-containing alcohol dehydrogenase [Alphaproteobacteria bacterium]